MKVKHEKHDLDAWICVCGNTPDSSGFYPVNEQGQEVEPTVKEWTTNEYKCHDCGVIINQLTLEFRG